VGGAGGSGSIAAVAGDLQTHCRTGGNVFYIEGNGYLYNGSETVTMGVWKTQASERSAVLTMYPTILSQGTQWRFEFSSQQLMMPLAVGTYDNAMRAPFATPGHPGIDISADSRGCNMEQGWFVITEWGVSGGMVQKLTVAFEDSCDTSRVRGCIHFVAP
jgi:hypothetical protein